MRTLRTIDLPSIRTASIGFDNLLSSLDSSFAMSQSQGFPPYNIVQDGEDDYTVSLAVAGFGLDDIEITKENNILTVVGKSPKHEEGEQPNYIHKGIAARNFRREFPLAEHVDVVGATLKLGMLHVHLHHEVPEALRPRKIEIHLDEE